MIEDNADPEPGFADPGGAKQMFGGTGSAFRQARWGKRDQMVAHFLRVGLEPMEFQYEDFTIPFLSKVKGDDTFTVPYLNSMMWVDSRARFLMI